MTLRTFYESAEEQFKDKAEGVSLWKRVGDEVLFYALIRSGEHVIDLVERSLIALRALNQTMAHHTALEKRQLAVKGACWAANAIYIEPSKLSEVGDRSTENVIFPDSPPNSALDFVGPDIDAGFRLGAHSAKNLLTVGAELAYSLFQLDVERFQRDLRIVGFEQLKGVWEDRYYPIVVYETGWSQLKDRFQYDDRFKSKMIERVLSTPTPPKALTTTDGRRFPEVLESAQRLDAARALLHAIQSSATSGPPLSVAQFDQLEVHCVAVVFDEEGHLLVARRSESKSVYPGHWEFGCAKLRSGRTWEEALRADYLADFGLSLEFPSSSRRFSPFDSYSFEKASRRICGSIGIARVSGGSPQPRYERSGKHSEVRWVTLQDAENLSPAVPDFIETARHATQRNTTLSASDSTPAGTKAAAVKQPARSTGTRARK